MPCVHIDTGVEKPALGTATMWVKRSVRKWKQSYVNWREPWAPLALLQSLWLLLVVLVEGRKWRCSVRSTLGTATSRSQQCIFPFLWSLENQKEILIKQNCQVSLKIEPNQHKMTPNPENLMKITGYAHSSDDEQSALSHINLVKAVDGLTETPGW